MFAKDVLKGKVVLVTGGASGIGLGICQYFGNHGADLAICSRSRDRLETAKKELEKNGIRVFMTQCDVRKPAEVEAAVDSVLKHYLKIDVLINCAAGNFLSSLSNLSYNAFRTVIEIDTIGTFNMTKCVFMAWMREHGGAILNISATLHYSGCLLQTHAGAAKAAIDAMTKHLAVELGPRGIRVNGVAPGPIEGTEGVDRLSSTDSIFGEFLPLGRLGTKKDVAEACLFLCLSDHITGQTLVVDGGSHLAAGNFPLLSTSLRSAWKGKL